MVLRKQLSRPINNVKKKKRKSLFWHLMIVLITLQFLGNTLRPAIIHLLYTFNIALCPTAMSLCPSPYVNTHTSYETRGQQHLPPANSQHTDSSKHRELVTFQAGVTPKLLLCH